MSAANLTFDFRPLATCHASRITVSEPRATCNLQPPPKSLTSQTRVCDAANHMCAPEKSLTVPVALQPKSPPTAMRPAPPEPEPRPQLRPEPKPYIGGMAQLK
jgi:hypothetical protein